MKVEVTELTCRRCGHKWLPRSTGVRICPHCKSYRWDSIESPTLGRKRNEKNL